MNKLRMTYLPILAVVGAQAPALAQESEFMLEGQEAVEKKEAPWNTQAELNYTSEVEVGAGYVSDDSFKFGEFNGLEEKGGFFIGNIDVNRRAPHDSDDVWHWRLWGVDLGLDTRSLFIKGGQQGKFKLFLGYDEIPHRVIDDGATPFLGAGSSNLTLPAGWVAGGDTRGMATLLGSLRPITIGTDRERFTLGAEGNLTRHWDLSATYKHEEKDGTRTIGGVIGFTGGNPRAAILPEPVNWSTDRFDVAVGYNNDRWRGKLQYSMWKFDNDGADLLLWDNPYSANPQWDRAAGFPTGRGGISGEPDNEAHQVLFSGAFDFTDTTQFRADLSWGEHKQDDTFVGYTVNPALNVPVPLPRNSLDGKIETTLINLEAISRPSPKLLLRGKYRYDNRDNKTPQDTYIYVGGDSQDQDGAPDSDRIRTNLPVSYKQNLFQLDGTYKAFRRTDLTLGYEYEQLDRTFSEVEKTKEHRIIGRLKTRWDSSSLKLQALWGDRNGSDPYDFAAQFRASFSPEHVASEGPPSLQWENLPGLRRVHIADRERGEFKARGMWMPTEMVSLGATLDIIRDDYNNSQFGVQQNDIDVFTVDVNYTPGRDMNVYGFYSYERSQIDQAGRSFSGTAKAAQSVDPNRNWFVFPDDTAHTVGAGATWAVIRNRLDVGVDYTYTKTEGDFDFTPGSALSAEPLPTLDTKLHRLRLYGTYNLKKNTALNIGYWYQKYDSTDWAFDNVVPNTLANVITLGESSPDYDSHVIWGSVSFKF